MQQTSVQKQSNLKNNLGGLKMKKFLKQLLNKRFNNEKGLTLIELLAVIVILAIVAAIAVPAIGNIIDNSRYKAVKADAINVINAANLYYTDGGAESPVKVSTLIEADFLETAGSIPNDATITMESPRAITTSAIKYSGEKTVTFSGATIDAINKDDNEGSGNGGYTITPTVTTGTTNNQNQNQNENVNNPS